MLFLLIEGLRWGGYEAEAAVGGHPAGPPVCAGGVLVSAALKIEPNPGGKGPERPSRALCFHQSGYGTWEKIERVQEKKKHHHVIVTVILSFILCACMVPVYLNHLSLTQQKYIVTFQLFLLGEILQQKKHEMMQWNALLTGNSRITSSSLTFSPLCCPIDVSPVVLAELIVRIHSTRLKLTFADAIFRNLCWKNGFTVKEEPLSLKKLVCVGEKKAISFSVIVVKW